MNEQRLRKLQTLLLTAVPVLTRLRERFCVRTAHDHQWTFIILFFALLLRLPLLAHPDHTQFDEVFLVNFTIHTLNGAPFFDIHPPLIRMIFAFIVHGMGHINIWALTMNSQQAFADFPFVALRSLTAIIGSLLPLLVYAIGRLLSYTPRMAAIPALFIVFDTALVVYARTMLPDTYLLLFNFLAIGAAFAAVRAPERGVSRALVVLAGVAAGLAISTKWLALAVLATIWLLFLLAKRWRAIIVTGLIATLVYLVVFTSYFYYFPNGGRVDPALFAFTMPWLTNIEFPHTTHLRDVGTFLIEHHRIMLHANDDPDITNYILQAPGPLSWPNARSSIDFWVGADGAKIIFQGNAFLWSLVFFLLLFNAGWIAWRWKNERKWPIDRNETVLLAGYAMNYLPFFLIHRPMYLYHYFTALLFLYLLAPTIAPRIIRCVGTLTNDRLFAQVFAFAVLILVFINFFLTLPTVYGF